MYIFCTALIYIKTSNILLLKKNNSYSEKKIFKKIFCEFVSGIMGFRKSKELFRNKKLIYLFGSQNMKRLQPKIVQYYPMKQSFFIFH